MRRNIVFILLFFPVLCWSQAYLGLKVGYSPISTISFKPDYKATAFIGKKPDFGLIFKYYNNKWAGLQCELNFTQKGYNVPYEETYKQSRVSNYVELPIFFQLRLNLAGVYLHGQAGCYAAYMLSSKEGYDTTGNMIYNRYYLNILKDVRFDYGLAGGAGLSHEFSWGVIQVEARIAYGFGDLFNYTYEGMPEQSKAVVQNINVSYMYNLSKLGHKNKQKTKQ
jgi:hypothetical protein